MSEKRSIEVSSEFLDKLFGMADMPTPADLSEEKLDKALTAIKDKLDAALAMSVSASAKSVGIDISQSSSLVSSLQENIKKVLIIDDLGIVTVQLEALCKKLGFAATTSKELYDAIEKYKAQDFGYVVADLFIPTEREGFMLVDEIKKISLLCKLNTKIIVMSASGKPEHRDKCLARGANHFVEKAPGWQDKIAEYLTAED
ncbi:MAG: response regulator [Candidatus Gastranaerophilales bacterium]|nr:response regulator [Candidatus Gastranaerophilales bacterium]